MSPSLGGLCSAPPSDLTNSVLLGTRRRFDRFLGNDFSRTASERVLPGVEVPPKSPTDALRRKSILRCANATGFSPGVDMIMFKTEKVRKQREEKDVNKCCSHYSVNVDVVVVPTRVLVRAVRSLVE